MAKVKVDKLGSARRFGSRYGTKPKHKFAKIEKEQRRKHKCPYCYAEKVRRQAAGIWFCSKCNAKFTGRAYTIKKVMFIEEAAPKKEVEAPEEDDDMLEDEDDESDSEDVAEEESKEEASEEQAEEVEEEKKEEEK